MADVENIKDGYKKQPLRDWRGWEKTIVLMNVFTVKCYYSSP